MTLNGNNKLKGSIGVQIIHLIKQKKTYENFNVKWIVSCSKWQKSRPDYLKLKKKS